MTTSPATILDGFGCLPLSESPSNPTGIGATEDDISMIWLNGNCTAANAVSKLEAGSPASANVAGIGQIFWGRGIAQLFNPRVLRRLAILGRRDILVYSERRSYLLR